jgi:hypothetical protein
MRFRTTIFIKFIMWLGFDTKLPAVDLLYVSMSDNSISTFDDLSNNPQQY